MTRPTNLLPQSLLKELFDYDPESGVLTWRIPYRKIEYGAPAGFIMRQSKSGRNALHIAIGRRHYTVHNIIWVLVTGKPPKNEIDHENHNAIDNRWQNLREATRSQNQANTRPYKNNKTGFRGVYFDKRVKRYKAVLSRSGKNKALGYFDSPEEAHKVWKAAAIEQHGEFASV